MSNDHQGVVSKKLRAAGYVPLPRWWAKPEDIEVIRRLISHHIPDIFRLRDEARLEKEVQQYEDWMEK
jgi:hypothetical protein